MSKKNTKNVTPPVVWCETKPTQCTCGNNNNCPKTKPNEKRP